MNALRLFSAASLAVSIPVVAALMVTDTPSGGTATGVSLGSASAFDAFVTEPEAGENAVELVAETLPVEPISVEGITEVVLARGPLLEDTPIVEVSSGSLGLSEPFSTIASQSQDDVAGVQALDQDNAPNAVAQPPFRVARSSFQIPGLSAPAQSGGPAVASASAPSPAISAVPLPAGALLLLTALGGAIALGRRAKR